MFSKKPAAAASAKPTPRKGARGGVLAVLPQNPLVGVGAAAALCAVAAVGLIAAIGDPRAGAPRARAPIGAPGVPPPDGWRQALTPETPGAAPVTLDTLDFNAEVTAPGMDAPPGQAVILMPGQAAPRGQGLPTAPLPGLSAPGPGGPLPVIAPDGRTAAKAYARPFRDDGRPKIALVIGGLGLNAQATRDAIERLPPEVTLSFVPYADGLQGWIDLARAAGHEVLLEIPMEPMDYPQNDPGPYTLLARSPAPETVRRLEWLMARAAGYFGVTNYLGGRFVTSEPGMTAFTDALRRRGLAFVDDGSAAGRGDGVPRASAARIVDDQLDGEAIDRQFLALEAAAIRNGQALGSGFAYPITIAQAQRWTQTLGRKGYALAPASALAAQR